jgi:hypothetical protein
MSDRSDFARLATSAPRWGRSKFSVAVLATIFCLPGMVQVASADGEWDFFVTPKWMTRIGDVKMQRLARDFQGNIFYDVGREKQNDSGFGFEVGTRFQIGNALGHKVYGRLLYNHLEVDGSRAGGGTVETFLLFPGFGVAGTNQLSNPNGYAIGGNNRHNYRSSYEYERHGFEGSVGLDMEFGRTEVYPWVGVRVGLIELDDKFKANVPIVGFPVQALYTTRTDVTSAGAFFGVDISHKLTETFSAFGHYKIGIDGNRAETDAKFRFSFPGFTDVQRISVTNEQATPWAYGEIGVRFQYGWFKSQLSVFGEHGSYAPDFRVPGGGERAFVEGQRETTYGIKFEVKADINAIFRPQRLY